MGLGVFVGVEVTTTNVPQPGGEVFVGVGVCADEADAHRMENTSTAVETRMKRAKFLDID